MFAAVPLMREIQSDEPWFINTRDGLEALRERLTTATFIGIDTEFERRRTYFAELCLVQLAVDDEMVCVDPIAIGTIAPLVEALDESPFRIMADAQSAMGSPSSPQYSSEGSQSPSSRSARGTMPRAPTSMREDLYSPER